jgi:hypothetical protein
MGASDGLPTFDIAAAEVYAVAAAPVEFRRSGAQSACGVFVLWTKR